MEKIELVEVRPQRFEQAGPMLLAGFSGRFTCETTEGIPALWQRFGPHIGQIDGQTGSAAYGVCYDYDDAGSFSYLVGVEVSATDGLPEGFSHVGLPPRRYAVFFHAGHVSTIKTTVQGIWKRWLPDSGQEAAIAPDFERYDERFDPVTGEGGFEIWIPLKS